MNTIKLNKIRKVDFAYLTSTDERYKKRSDLIKAKKEAEMYLKQARDLKNPSETIKILRMVLAAISSFKGSDAYEKHMQRIEDEASSLIQKAEELMPREDYEKRQINKRIGQEQRKISDAKAETIAAGIQGTLETELEEAQANSRKRANSLTRQSEEHKLAHEYEDEDQRQRFIKGENLRTTALNIGSRIPIIRKVIEPHVRANNDYRMKLYKEDLQKSPEYQALESDEARKEYMDKHSSDYFKYINGVNSLADDIIGPITENLKGSIQKKKEELTDQLNKKDKSDTDNEKTQEHSAQNDITTGAVLAYFGRAQGKQLIKEAKENNLDLSEYLKYKFGPGIILDIENANIDRKIDLSPMIKQYYN